MNLALVFYALGVATIPVHYREKTPLLSSWRPYQTQMPSPASILSWFSQPANIGVVTGWHGLLVLDFDDINIYARWLQWAKHQGAFSIVATIACNAYRVSTARGVHVYVWSDTPERNRKLPGIDVKARNGYVLGEGSVHPSGALYTALKPGMIIPRIATLNDILPTTILLQTEQKPHVQTLPLPPILSDQNDPWALAEQPGANTTYLVETIRRQLRITDLLPHTERTSTDGRWLRCQCPLHDDDSPSFWIDTQQQICGCFAGCTDKPLDVINLYARLYGLSNREAIFALQRIVT